MNKSFLWENLLFQTSASLCFTVIKLTHWLCLVTDILALIPNWAEKLPFVLNPGMHECSLSHIHSKMFYISQCPDRKEEPLTKAWVCRELFQFPFATYFPLPSGCTFWIFPILAVILDKWQCIPLKAWAVWIRSLAGPLVEECFQSVCSHLIVWDLGGNVLPNLMILHPSSFLLHLQLEAREQWGSLM